MASQEPQDNVAFQEPEDAPSGFPGAKEHSGSLSRNQRTHRIAFQELKDTPGADRMHKICVKYAIGISLGATGPHICAVDA